MNTAALKIGSIIAHPSFGRGVIVDVKDDFYKIYFYNSEELKDLTVHYNQYEIIEGEEQAVPAITLADMEMALENVLYKMSAIDEPIKLGDKWMKGKLVIHPGSSDMQIKEIPIDGFFHKIVMVRDRLRVLEQNINSHPKLDDEDRVHLQQYITRCYGSLTTFNVLFKDKFAHFKGEGKDA